MINEPINELTLEIDNNGGVTIPIQNESDNDCIDQPIFDPETGTWTVNFLKPLAAMASVEELTLESSSLPS